MFPLEKKAVTSLGKKKILVSFVEVQRKQAPEGKVCQGGLTGVPGTRQLAGLVPRLCCTVLAPPALLHSQTPESRLQWEHSVPLTKPPGISEGRAVSPSGRARSPCGFLKESLVGTLGFAGIPEHWEDVVSSSMMKAGFCGIPFLDLIFQSP